MRKLKYFLELLNKLSPIEEKIIKSMNIVKSKIRKCDEGKNLGIMKDEYYKQLDFINLIKCDFSENVIDPVCLCHRKILSQTDESFIKSMLKKVNEKYDGKFITRSIDTVLYYINEDNKKESTLVDVNAIFDNKLLQEIINLRFYPAEIYSNLLSDLIEDYSNQGKFFIIKDDKYLNYLDIGSNQIVGATLNVNISKNELNKSQFTLLNKEYPLNITVANQIINKLSYDKNSEIILKGYLESVEERIDKIVPKELYQNIYDWIDNFKLEVYLDNNDKKINNLNNSATYFGKNVINEKTNLIQVVNIQQNKEKLFKHKNPLEF